MKSPLFLFPFLIAFLSALPSLAQQSDTDPDNEITEEESYDWQLVKKKNGISIYLRAIEGTNLKQCKAVYTVHAPSADILALLTTPERNPEWIATYRDSRLIKKVNSNEYYSYNKIMTPWYSSNRDIILNTSFRELKSGGFIIHSVGVPDYLPAQENCIRISRFDVSWVAKTVSKKETAIIQQVIASPGGNVSDRVANSKLGGSCYRTAVALKQKMEGPKSSRSNRSPLP